MIGGIKIDEDKEGFEDKILVTLISKLNSNSSLSIWRSKVIENYWTGEIKIDKDDKDE